MTEQELREKFESKRKGDDFSTVLLCGQKAYWNKTVQRDWEMFKDGYKTAQETIEKQKKEIKELTSKIYEAYSMQASIAKNDLTSTGVHLKIQQLDHEQMIKAKDAEIERLKESKIIAELLIDEKDKAIAEAREMFLNHVAGVEHICEDLEVKLAEAVEVMSLAEKVDDVDHLDMLKNTIKQFLAKYRGENGKD